MTTSDPISDMLTRIKNAQIVRKPSVLIPSSKIKIEILKVLRESSLIENFAEIGKAPKISIEVFLKYSEDNTPYILDVKRISKPSRRVYIENKDINIKKQNLIVLSTSKGIMTAKSAKKQQLGGEVLFEIY